MSGGRERLESRLRELGRLDAGAARASARRPSSSSASPPAPAPGRRSALRIRSSETLGSRHPRRDPLSGHRGLAEGLQLLARAGHWLVELQVRDESGGLVLRGQLLPSGAAQGSPAGALLHVLAGGEARLACVDSGGELVLRDLPEQAFERVLLELEDGVHDLGWPTEAVGPE